MKRMTILALATALSASAAIPALADDYVRLGSVDVGFHTDRDTTWNRFGGGMEGLRFVADKSDVKCRSVTVEYGDGSRQEIFRGPLFEDRPVNVDLAGGSRRVRNIAFTCRSDERSGAKIYIAADVGRFRDEWRRSPDWMLFWSHLFNWGAPPPPPAYDASAWVPLGRERFEGRGDRENNFAGWNGRSIDRLGFRAVDDDARCRKVRVTFGSGKTQELDVGQLDQGRMKVVDLPGNFRNVTNLNMVCRAMNKYAVTVEISARK
jgi:hypothetical protein